MYLNDVSQLKSFLGPSLIIIVNFYSNVFHALLAPVYVNLTKNKIVWDPTNECKLAFDKVKRALVKFRLLINYGLYLPFT